MKKRLLTMLVAVLTAVLVISVPAAALSESAIPTGSYSYWLGYKKKKLVYTKPIYEYESTVDSKKLGYNNFSKPSDIFCGNDGTLIILEEASRISILDGSGKLVNTIEYFVDENGTKYSFEGAKGVFLSDEGDIFVADTANSRILKGDKNGKLKTVLEKPVSDLIPSDFIYNPIKIDIDKKGYMYVVSSGSTYGALLFEPNGSFDGFYGANTVKASFTSLFTTLWSKFLASDEQLSAQIQKIPYVFTDLCIDNSDMVYTVTGVAADSTEQTAQIRCLNPKGSNILTVKDSNKYSNTSDFNFGDVDVADQRLGTGKRLQNFTSIDVDSDGFIYALDDTYGRIFVYDAESNLLSAFGGGNGEGNQKGTFVQANAVAVSGNKLYVSDYGAGTITVFKLNDYGTLLKKADKTYLSGDYESAEPLWQDVNKYDPNCQIAYHGLAKVNLVNGNYDDALYYAKEGLDYNSYNQAFSYVRNNRLKATFRPLLAVILLIIICIIAFEVLKKKFGWKLRVNNKVKVAVGSCIHPFESSNAIKFKNQGSAIISLAILALYYIFEVLGKTRGGFLYSRVDMQDFNAIYTLVGSIGVILLWTICYWASAVLFSGKCKLREVFIISSYAMIPQIINGIFYLICSNALVLEESTAITVVSVIAMILSGIVICIGCMVVSKYGFFKFLGVTVVAVFAMAIVIFVVFMVLTLDQQLFSFGQSVFKEIIYR